jgi:hypothetical protein
MLVLKGSVVRPNYTRVLEAPSIFDLRDLTFPEKLRRRVLGSFTQVAENQSECLTLTDSRVFGMLESVAGRLVDLPAGQNLCARLRLWLFLD